ncbi:YqkE family protein [Bacillus sp. N9]
MSKKRAKTKRNRKNPNVTLADELDQSVLEKLKETKRDLLEKVEQKKVAEKDNCLRKKAKRKNKTFEELLNETSLNWREFK